MRNRKHDIEKYLRGKLSSDEMHALEKEALSDPFLAEALEGIEQAGADNFLYDLHKINRSVHARMRKPRKHNKVISMWGWSSVIAATLLLIAISGFLVVSLLKDQRQRQQAMQAASENETEPAKDTLTIVAPAEAPVPVKRDRESALLRDGRPQATPSTSPSKFRAQPEVDEAESANESTSEKDNVANAEESRTETEHEVEVNTEGNAVSQGIQSSSARAESKKASPTAKTGSRESNVIRGQVLDESGRGLPGVNIIIKGTNTGTVTDAAGNYELPVPDEASKLVFNFIGYETREEGIAGKEALNVTMEEDSTTLSEVVVTGYGAAGSRSVPESFRFAEPAGGRNDFRTYLSTAIKYPQDAIQHKTEGRVTVRFTVEPDGQLTNFEILKGIGFGCEEELIRAIRQGPAWAPSKRDDQPVQDRVRVRYRFVLEE
jgi:TonB family C-terminal domain